MMPLAFGSLLGGVMTLIGTSPNIIVSRVREDLTGHPFSMFDFFPVGAGIAVTGLIFLIFGWRLLPERRSPTSSAEGELHIRDYLTEVRMLPNSPLIDGTVGDLEALSGGAVTVAALIRDKGQQLHSGRALAAVPGRYHHRRDDPENLKKLLAAGKLEIATRSGTAKDDVMEPWEELVLMETVVAPSSPLVGCTHQGLPPALPLRRQRPGAWPGRPPARNPTPPDPHSSRRRHGGPGAEQRDARRFWPTSPACRWPTATSPSTSRAGSIWRYRS